MTPDSEPRVGQRVNIYDYSSGKHENWDKIALIMNKGLKGWIVQTDTGLYIEVESVKMRSGYYAWKEIPPKENDAKHKGH